MQEVEAQLSKVRPNKAPGPDGIMSWMLRDLAAVLAGPVAALIHKRLLCPDQVEERLHNGAT